MIKLKEMKRIKIMGLTAIVLVLFGMTTLLQQKDYNALIVGDWKSEGCSTCVWRFKENGKCYDYYKGKIDATFSYTIHSSKTESGRTHYSLKLVNVEDSNDVYEYSINGLSEKRMHLEYNTGIGLSQLFFEKQND